METQEPSPNPAPTRARWIGYLAAFALLVVAGCDGLSPDTSGGLEEQATDAETRTAEVESLNEQLALITQAVAKLTAEEQVASQLHDLVLEKFDGETNVLWMHLDQDEESSFSKASSSWSDLVAQAVPASAGKVGEMLSNAQVVADVISRASELHGGAVHLFWPYAEEWDGTTAPSVAYVPLGIDPDEIVTLEAFDTEGEIHVFDDEKARKQPLLVLTRNERTSLEGELLPGFVEDLPTEQGEAGSSESYGKSSAQSDYRPLVLTRFKFDSEYKEPHVSNGRPEFVVDAFGVGSATTAIASWNHKIPTSTYPPFTFIPGTTFEYNKVIYSWNTDRDASFHLRWRELDGGETVTVQRKSRFKFSLELAKKLLKINGEAERELSFSYSYKNDDDLLGITTIYEDQFGHWAFAGLFGPLWSCKESFPTGWPDFVLELRECDGPE